MAPIGPYMNTQKWCDKDYYIVPVDYHGIIAVSIVQDGQQPQDGMVMTSLRDAKRWLFDNGFELVRKEN